MLINSYEVVDRGNRPNVSQRVGLRVFFINDGAYVDPYEISSVGIFTKAENLSPSTILDATTNLLSATPLMEFGASGQSETSHANFAEANYQPTTTASGIYKLGTGDYVVVLDQTLNLSGYDYITDTELGASSVSSVNDYIDVWTVKLAEASDYQVIINNFALYQDTFFAFTEPILLTTTNKLMNKHVRLGEKLDLKIGTETTVQNKKIDKSIQDIFKDSCITSAMLDIRKVNQDPAFAGPFTVSGFSDTSATVDITTDNTILFNWDTAGLSLLDGVGAGTFGSVTGTYSVQAKYTLLNETIISPLFYLTVS
jgi:hypothetical protein